MSILEITNLSKSYGNKTILKDLNLTCKKGEIIGLLGRNGIGKSTLLKLIYGTEKADTITLKFNTKPLAPKKVIPSKQIAYLPQHSFLPKDISVRKVIPLFYSDGNEQETIFYAPKVASFEHLKIRELSQGQLRYLEVLIIGHLNHPFIMLDEPFSMIEPIYKEVIKDTLLNLKASKGIIITDHYYDDVFDISDKNFLIKDAKTIEVKSKKDLVEHDYLSPSNV